jgi:hypothetical protein
VNIRATIWAVLTFAMLWATDRFVHQEGALVVERFADSAREELAVFACQLLRVVIFALHWLIPAIILGIASTDRIGPTIVVTAFICGAIAPFAKAIGLGASDILRHVNSDSIAEGLMEGAVLCVFFGIFVAIFRFVRKRSNNAIERDAREDSARPSS